MPKKFHFPIHMIPSHTRAAPRRKKVEAAAATTPEPAYMGDGAAFTVDPGAGVGPKTMGKDWDAPGGSALPTTPSSAGGGGKVPSAEGTATASFWFLSQWPATPLVKK